MIKQVKTLIERIEIEASSNERDSVLADLDRNGYAVKSIGPYSDRKMFPKVDPSRFKLVAERCAAVNEPTQAASPKPMGKAAAFRSQSK